MDKFVMTPAIEWLEANMEANKKHDDTIKRPMFSLHVDHECEGGDYDGFDCLWKARDHTDSWYYWFRPGVSTEEIVDNWMRPDRDLDFEYLLEEVTESPFYQAIGQ